MGRGDDGQLDRMWLRSANNDGLRFRQSLLDPSLTNGRDGREKAGPRICSAAGKTTGASRMAKFSARAIPVGRRQESPDD
jgi:hypothetical protein